VARLPWQRSPLRTQGADLVGKGLPTVEFCAVLREHEPWVGLYKCAWQRIVAHPYLARVTHLYAHFCKLRAQRHQAGRKVVVACLIGLKLEALHLTAALKLCTLGAQAYC